MAQVLHLCEILDPVTNTCVSWVEYSPQYIIPQLSLSEAVILGLGYWTILLVAAGISSIRHIFDGK